MYTYSCLHVKLKKICVLLYKLFKFSISYLSYVFFFFDREDIFELLIDAEVIIQYINKEIDKHNAQALQYKDIEKSIIHLSLSLEGCICDPDIQR